MRIVFLSRGDTVHERRFLEKMVERGHKPYLITYLSTGCAEDATSQNSTAQRPILSGHAVLGQVQVEGVETLCFEQDRLVRFGHLRSLQIAAHLRRVLKDIKPDVLHTGWVIDHGFWGALTNFHPTLSMPYGSDILIKANQLLNWRMIAKFTLRRADMITCDCMLVKNRIIQLTSCPPEKIVVFPWGVNLNIFRPSKGVFNIREQLGWEDKKILIMTRHFLPIYGIEYFIEALPTIIREKPEVRVIFVSSGPLKNTCQNRVAELALADYVYFAGRATEVELADYLNSADIYVNTSLSDGTSSSLLEAMACGLPVVVSDAPANFEWVEDGINGFIVPRCDSLMLAERIIRLLDDVDLGYEMGRRNLEIAKQRADWEKNFDRLEEIYGALVARRVSR